MTSQQEADALLEFRRVKLSQGFSKEEIDVLLLLVEVVDWEQQRLNSESNHSNRAVRYETETAIEGVM